MFFYNSNRKFRYALSSFILFLSLVIYSFMAPKSIAAAGGWALFILIVCIISFLINRQKLMSFPVVFSIATWFFHFGFYFIYFFDKEDMIYANDFIYYSDDLLLKTFNAGFIFFIFLIIGLNYPFKEKSILRNCNVLPQSSIKRLRLIACILFVPYIIFILSNFVYDGYYSRSSSAFSSLFGYVTDVFIGICILLFANAHRYKQKLQMLVLCLVFLPAIFTGNRFYSICVYLIYALIVFSNRKIKLKSVLLFLSVFFLTFYLVVTIGNYRGDYSLMFSKIFDFENFVSFTKTNPMLVICEQFGGTITSLTAAVKNFNPSNFFYGFSYIASLTLLIPGLSSSVPPKYLTYVYAFPSSDNHHLGGSFFGEAYVNFGILAFALLFLLGIVIKKIYAIEKQHTLERSYYSYWIYIVYYCLLTLVRGYIKNVWFLPVWFLIIFFLFGKRTSTAVYSNRCINEVVK